MKAHSRIYPSLLVTHPKVQFVEGEAEISVEDANLLSEIDPGVGVVIIPDAEGGKRRSLGK